MEAVIVAVFLGFIYKVHFADGGGLIAVIFEVMGDGISIGRKGILQDAGPVGVRIDAGDDGSAGGNTDGRLAVSPVEANAGSGKFVDVGRVYLCVTVAAGGGCLVLVRDRTVRDRIVRDRNVRDPFILNTRIHVHGSEIPNTKISK